MVKAALISVLFSMIGSMSCAQYRAEAEVSINDLSTSQALGIGVASGWPLEDISDLIIEFPSLNAFEDRRKRGEAVELASRRGREFVSAGFPQLVLRAGEFELGEYNFNDGSFRICLPFRSSSLKEDIPTNAFTVELEYYDENGAPSRLITDFDACSGRTFGQVKVRYMPRALEVSDSFIAERIYNEVQKDGGKFSAAVLCDLNRLEKTATGGGGSGFGGSLKCSVIGIYLSFGGQGYDSERLFYREVFDPLTSQVQKTFLLD